MPVLPIFTVWPASADADASVPVEASTAQEAAENYMQGHIVKINFPRQVEICVSEGAGGTMTRWLVTVAISATRIEK